MALKKTKTLQNGTNGEYWRILQLNNNFNLMDSALTIALYVSKTARNNGALPIDQFHHLLGEAFSERLYNGSDKVKNIKLSEAYKEFKKQAQDEAEKPADEQNAGLAWFADVVDDE